MHGSSEIGVRSEMESGPTLASSYSRSAVMSVSLTVEEYPVRGAVES